jgi:CheY-like chemotaxis protein
MQRAVASYLENMACRCDVAKGLSGLEFALRRMEETDETYAAVIIDESLESVTGYSILGTIKDDPRLAHAAFLLIAPVIGRLDAHHSKFPAAVQRLHRPLTRKALYAALAAALLGGATSEVEGTVEVDDPSIATSRETTAVNITSPRRDVANKRILLVEDNAVNQLVALAALRRLGLEADVAEHGEAALEALQARDYALVLMDIHMPGMDGYQATRVIRDPKSAVRDHDVPVLAMTATVLREDRTACLEAGMNDFVAKPIRQDELAATLRFWLG